jgi:hypothetical protein
MAMIITINSIQIIRNYSIIKLKTTYLILIKQLIYV